MKSGGQWMISQSSAESDYARVSSCVPGQEAIYRVVPELNQVAVYARHIFYDLLDNMVKSLKPSSSAMGASVVQELASSCESEHPFSFFSDLEATAEEVEYTNVHNLHPRTDFCTQMHPL